MKFSDGYWMKREGVRVHSPREIRDVRVEEQAVTLTVAPHLVENRGQTLNSLMFTMTFTSPCPGILSLETAHFLGRAGRGPDFELADAHCPLEVVREENRLVIASGPISVEITLKEYQAVYRYNGRVLTSTGFRKTGYAQAPEGNFMLEQLDLAVGEKIYGLGERFTPFVKNGQSVDIWNRDGGTASEQAYKNIPFYLSSEGYGVLVDYPGLVSYEVASEVVSRVQFSIQEEAMRYLIIGGDSRKEVLEAYTGLTGRPALPPAWSFGLWLTTSFTTSYDEGTVTGFIDGMLERDIPLQVFHYDCFWMKEYEWCNFTWDPDQFPDVEGMLTRLREKGLKICVWINPYIGQKSPLFAEGKEKGYLLKTVDGHVWQWDLWQAGMALVDFTNPAACEWYKEKLRALLHQGVDCFKTDFGERIPAQDVVYFDGSDPRRMHNYYTQLYNRAVFDLLVEERGEGEAVLFARSATVGGQQYPVHWGGDCDSTYPSMAESLRGGLSLTLSGFGFWSHDISGFENTASPDLYKRWSAFGLLSTHSRLHGSSSYRVPWLFGDEAVDVLRHFTKLKCRLMPYLYGAAVHASRTGVPAMRAMLLEFEGDPACLELDTQYMLGDRVLVAPVFREDGSVSYYLPRGRWTHLLTGEVLEGGGWRQESHDYFSLPLLVRENTLLPVGGREDVADYDYQEDLTLRLYQLQEGGKAEITVYNIRGEECLHAVAIRSEGKVTLSMRGDRFPRLELVGIPEVAGLSGAVQERGERGAVLGDIANGTVSFALSEEVE